MADKQLTPHFSLSELTHSDTAISRGIDNTPLPEHLHNLETYTAPGLEQCRVVCGNRPMDIHVAYRNPQINKLVGGTATSAHPLGFAADFCIAGENPITTARTIAAAMKAGKLKIDQLIVERTPPSVVHVSFDPRGRGMMGRQAGGPGTPIDWKFFDV
jgi:hypothetical protein